MTGTTDRLVVRSRLIPWLVGMYGLLAAGCVGLVVTADHATVRWTLIPVAAVALGLTARAARMRIVADPDGVTARQLGSTRRYRWPQISELGTREHVRIAARLVDGREVGLLHYRGLGDTSTDRVARELDVWARRHRRSDAAVTPPAPPRRLPRGAVLALAALLVTGSATYAVWSGHWAGLASGMLAALMGRYLRSTPGDGREFRPVSPPPGPVQDLDAPQRGGGPRPGPSSDAAD